MLAITAVSRIPFGILSIAETFSVTPGTTAPVLSDTVPNSLPSARPCGAGGDVGCGADDLLAATDTAPVNGGFSTGAIAVGNKAGAVTGCLSSAGARVAASGNVTKMATVQIANNAKRLTDR